MRRRGGQVAGFASLPQRFKDGSHVRGRKFGQGRPVYEGRRLLIGQTDIARPLQGEHAVRCRLAKSNAERLFESPRDLPGALHEGNRGLGETDTVAALRLSIKESVKGHHLLDLDRVDAED